MISRASPSVKGRHGPGLPIRRQMTDRAAKHGRRSCRAWQALPAKTCSHSRRTLSWPASQMPREANSAT
eukprot:1618783-Lingulodinium_polyedra.AAC.1